MAKGNRVGQVLVVVLLGCMCFPTAVWSQVALFQASTSKTSNTIPGDHPQVKRTNTLRLADKMNGKNGVLPSVLSFNPFPDVNIELYLDEAEASSFKGLQVIRAKSNDPNFEHLPNYRDAVVIYNPYTNRYVIQMSTSAGSFEVIPNRAPGIYKVSEWSKDGFDCRSAAHHTDALESNKNNAKSGCNELDANGIYVADLFIGYSYEASFHVQDYDAHALSLTEEVNNGLINSGVTNIRIRLVGTGISDHNPGVVTSVLGDFYDWFADEIVATAPDYVASVQVPTGAENEAGGWAGVGGYSSVNSIYSAAAVFRHELGHNIGSSHCTPGILPYAAGYNNGNVKTHMCGNNINFYSTPLINDAMGIPIGDAVTADNARVWRERAAHVSARRKHTILFDPSDVGCGSAIANGRYHIQNVNNDKYLGTLNGSSNNGTILALTDVTSAANEWDLVGVGDGKFRFIHVASGRYIDVPGGTSAAGADLLIWNAHGGSNQIHTITATSSNTYTIQVNNGQCIQVEGAGNTANDPIEQNTCDGSDNTLWRFLPTGSGTNLGLTVNITDVACFGNASGSATVVATGGTGNYTYTWSNEGVGISQSNLTSGGYTVTVSDGATDVPYSFVISQSAAITTTIVSTESNGNDGTITLSPAGGVSPYSYTWSNGASGNAITELVPGLYIATITDAGGCSQVKEIYVPCGKLGGACSDSNPKTVGDTFDDNCNCVGVPISCSEDSEVINVALSKPTSQITTDYDGPSNLAVDGNTSGIYSEGSTTHTTGTDTLPWWELDLEESININALTIWNRADCCTGRLKNFYVLISETPFLSKDLSASINQSGVWSLHVVNKASPNVVIQPNVTGRYVRIQKVDVGVLSLAEVEVFTCRLCIYYADTDNDGFGDANSSLSSSCLTVPVGYVANDLDCNDSDLGVTPSTVSSCGPPLPEIIIATPKSDDDWLINGRITPKGNSVTSAVLEYGEGDFSNSTTISLSGSDAINVFDFDQTINISDAITYQFRLKILSDGIEYFSNVYTIDPNQEYCIPTDDNDLWYKRFSKVEFNGVVHTDGGNTAHGVFQDATDMNFGALDPGSSYTFQISVPSSWSNLTYYIYIDLNDDKDFTDYHELVGSAAPDGDMTAVTVVIPTTNVVMEQTLRMRIVGAETSGHNTCYTAVGNTRDFSLSLNNNCTGTTWFADTNGNGLGDPRSTVVACDQPNGYVDNSNDCNESTPDYNTWFVDNINGSDDNDGTLAMTAYKTVKSLVSSDKIEPGDTVKLIGEFKNENFGDGDVWTSENSIRIHDLHGNNCHYITFMPYSDGTVLKGDGGNVLRVTQSSYLKFEGFEIYGEVENITLSTALDNQFIYKDSDGNIQRRVPIGATVAEVQGMTFPALSNITRPSYTDTRGAYFSNCNHINFSGCEVHHMPGTGLRFAKSDYINIIENDIHNNSRRSYTGTHGMVIHSAESYDNSDAHKIIIERNKVHHNYNEIYSWAPTKTIITPHIDEGKGISLQKNSIENGWTHGRFLVKNNLTYWNGFSGIHNNEGTRMDFVHNTCYYNSFTGTETLDGEGTGNQIGMSSQSGSDITFLNNIIVTDPNLNGFTISIGGNSNITVANNFVYGGVDADVIPIQQNNRSGDPLFVDPDQFDFNLSNNSPAINIGGIIFGINKDYYNNDRDSQPDLGAIENVDCILGIRTFYADADNDGFGSMVDSLLNCVQPEGYVDNNNDCDDSNAQIGECTNQTTSTNDLNKDKFKISISPNPTRDMAYLKFELSENLPVGIIISNVDGSEVKHVGGTTTYAQGEHIIAIDLNGFHPGLYLVRIQTSGAAVTQKLVVSN